MSSGINLLKELTEMIKEESKNSVEDFKKSDPKFQKMVADLFSLKLSIQETQSNLVYLVMQFAEYPQRAEQVIPSIMDTTKDIEHTKKLYKLTKKYPVIYPYSLNALQLQYVNLKELWNQKVWKMICITKMSTKSQPSIWRALGSAGSLESLFSSLSDKPTEISSEDDSL